MGSKRPGAASEADSRPSRPCILTMNGGSSSIRFAVYEASNTPQLRFNGKIDRIGVGGTTMTVSQAAGARHAPIPVAAAGHGSAIRALLTWLEAQPFFASIIGVGHRIVQGMTHGEPELITPRLLVHLRRITSYDPDHLPGEIALIKAVARRHPKLSQVACFDTAFHRSMPRVARLVPIPRRYAVERHGFHGLSYAYLMEELGRLDPVASDGRVILAHLGSGASMAAVRRGKSIDTSMGFTPASGLVMSRRSGDVDPGLVYYLARTARMTAARFQHMVNHESGLLGVSGTSSDVRDLLAREAGDERAADALALFCYQVKKGIGAYVAALGGLDVLVFAGGIGEHAPQIRERVCDGLDWLGIALDLERNAKNAPLISRDASRVTVRVIGTNEELMIARSVMRLLKLGSTAGA